MKFLRKLFKTYNAQFDEAVKPEETVARYLYSKGNFNQKSVRLGAFLPNPKNGQTSVFRTKDLNTDEVRTLSKSARKDKPPYSIAIFKAVHVLHQGLTFNPNNYPIRHADIIDWPAEKYEQKDLAREIAKSAKLIKY